MGERYRKLLTSYRPPKPPTPLPRQGRLFESDRADTLVDIVRRLLATPIEPEFFEERRHSFRRPYPKAVWMTPCDALGKPRHEERVTVVVKDISPGSIGFVHNRALRDKHVVLAMQVTDNAPICLVTAIRRVQPVRQGLYLVGGEFVARMDPEEYDVTTVG